METTKAKAEGKVARKHIGKRITLVIAGLSGAAGVGLSAAAAHMEEGQLLATAATMLLAHAPALLALAAWQGRLRLATTASFVIAAGLILFVADLGYRFFFGAGMFPMAAPTGGVLMIIGWLIVAIGALFRIK